MDGKGKEWKGQEMRTCEKKKKNMRTLKVGGKGGVFLSFAFKAPSSHSVFVFLPFDQFDGSWIGRPLERGGIVPEPPGVL
jgi:hypothetical protein